MKLTFRVYVGDLLSIDSIEVLLCCPLHNGEGVLLDSFDEIRFDYKLRSVISNKTK